MSGRAGPGAPGGDALAAMKRSVVAHYESRLAEFGATARGMDWKDEDSQALRFDRLCRICDLGGRSVHEVGAGAGHLLDFLRARGVQADYSGSDLSGAMVEAARARHPGIPFAQHDILAGPVSRTYDVVVCSGLFHVKLGHAEGAWRDFVRKMIARMFEMCRVGIAFNMMSDRVDYREEALYYADPGEMLGYCRRTLSPRVALFHDYPLHEYTVHVHRRVSGADEPHGDHAGPERGGER